MCNKQERSLSLTQFLNYLPKSEILVQTVMPGNEMGLSAAKPVFRVLNKPALLQRLARKLKFCM